MTHDAALRTFDTLLRNAPARSVMLRLPAPADAADNNDLYGLATPLFQDIELAPAVFRKIVVKTTADGHREYELLVSATAVAALTGSQDFGSADALFASAYSVVIDNTLLTITGAREIEAGGVACGYILTLRQPPPSR
jgi:hypothetical protein